MSILAKGFRPFFLLAGLHATAAMALWLWSLHGGPPEAGSPGLAFGVRDHAHEMVHGFTVAVLAGFLLTAVGNWTGRETLVGPPLGALALLWLLPRGLLRAPPESGPHRLGVLLDLGFLPLLALVIARPLWAARNVRNAAFPLLLLLLWAASLAGRVEPSLASRADRFAVHLVALAILLVTGRIVPLFTRNATGAAVRSSPVLDGLSFAALGGLALLDLLLPGTLLAEGLAALAAGAILARARGWALGAARRDPLLLVLHLGHLAVGLSLLMRASGGLWPALERGALHLLTVGGVGLLTLGMMARVALGHTGRPLRAARPTALAFALLGLGALVRALGPALWADPRPTRLLAGLLWLLAFALFLAVYTPILLRPRVDGKPG